MKVQTKPLEDHRVELSVEFDENEFESYKRRTARRLARKTKIPGYRPGKAPYGVLVRHFGEGHIIEHAIEDAIEDQYDEILKQADINPYGPLKLEEIVSVSPSLVLRFLVALDAEVKLGDYKSIRIPFEPPDVSDEDLKEYFSKVQNQYPVIEPVERKSQAGDLVDVVINAKELNSEDEQNPLFQDYETSIIVKEDEEESEWPFPGFSKQLINREAGEKLTLEHEFPEDYSDKNYAGKQVEFNVEIKQVSKRELPELNDEFAQTYSQFETMDELREAVKKQLEQEKLNEYTREYIQKIIDKIIEESEITYPPEMLDEAIADYKKELENRLQQYGMNIDLYKQVQNLSEEQFEEEVKQAASKGLKEDLVIYEIAQKEEIQVDSKAVQAEADYTLQLLNQSRGKRRFTKEKQALNSRVYSSLLIRHLKSATVDWLLNNAKGEFDKPDEVVADGAMAEQDSADSPEVVETQQEESQNEENPDEESRDDTK